MLTISPCWCGLYCSLALIFVSFSIILINFNKDVGFPFPRLNTPGQQSSMQGLPPTPMPAPGMFKTPVQQNNMLASGLTRMEEGYLSP